MKTRMISPGRTAGFREFASSLTFSTCTPWSCATLFKLKSLVTIFPSYTLASSISFISTARTCGKSSSTICTSTTAIFWMRCRMSRPRRPRLRLSESEESAISCNSRSTNWGIMSVPSTKPVSQTSAIRPSMITLVSRILKVVFVPRSPLKTPPNAERFSERSVDAIGRRTDREQGCQYADAVPGAGGAGDV